VVRVVDDDAVNNLCLFLIEEPEGLGAGEVDLEDHAVGFGFEVLGHVVFLCQERLNLVVALLRFCQDVVDHLHHERLCFLFEVV